MIFDELKTNTYRRFTDLQNKSSPRYRSRISDNVYTESGLVPISLDQSWTVIR